MGTVKRKAKKDSFFKGKILLDMQKDWERDRASNAWLRIEDVLFFDHNLILSYAKQEVAHTWYRVNEYISATKRKATLTHYAQTCFTIQNAP
jgi:hypothetical protein